MKRGDWQGIFENRGADGRRRSRERQVQAVFGIIALIVRAIVVVVTVFGRARSAASFAVSSASNAVTSIAESASAESVCWAMSDVSTPAVESGATASFSASAKMPVPVSTSAAFAANSLSCSCSFRQPERSQIANATAATVTLRLADLPNIFAIFFAYALPQRGSTARPPAIV